MSLVALTSREGPAWTVHKAWSSLVTTEEEDEAQFSLVLYNLSY